MKALILFFALSLPAQAYEQCWPEEDICLTEVELDMTEAEWDEKIEFDEVITILEDQLWPDYYWQE